MRIKYFFYFYSLFHCYNTDTYLYTGSAYDYDVEIIGYKLIDNVPVAVISAYDRI